MLELFILVFTTGSSDIGAGIEFILSRLSAIHEENPN